MRGQDRTDATIALAAGVTSRQIEADHMAAVLACGKGALLMGAPAAHLFELTKGEPPRPVVKTRTQRRIEGIETHRTRSGEHGDVFDDPGMTLTELRALLA